MSDDAETRPPTTLIIERLRWRDKDGVVHQAMQYKAARRFRYSSQVSVCDQFNWVGPTEDPVTCLECLNE